MAAPLVGTRIQVEFPEHARPSTSINVWLMLGMAVVMSLAVFGLAFVIGGFIKDLLMGDPEILMERVIFQGSITFVWSCSMCTVLLKFLKMKKEKAGLDESVIPEGTDLTNKEKMVEVYERVKSKPELTENLGLTRVARVLAMWINTDDFERTSQYAHLQADMDAMSSDASFRANRLYIWAMPLLGFVGTVFGVAAGISGFSGFLKQASVTPEQIKSQVGDITTGLAVAFFCTLLGLMTAGIAAFPSLAAEKGEEEALSEIEEFVEDRMLSHMPSIEKKLEFPMEEMAKIMRESLSGLQTQAQIKFPVEDLALAIDNGFKRLPNPDRYEEVFSRAIAKAGDLINQKYDEFAQNYERRVSELGSQLGGKLEAVGNAFNAGTNQIATQVGGKIEAVGNAFNSGTQRLAQQITDQTQKVGQTLSELEGRQAERLDGLIESMQKLGAQMPEEFRKAQDRYLELQAKTEQKTIDRFEELNEQITTAGKEQSEQFADAHEKYLDAINDLDKKEIARWEKMVADFNKLAGQLGDSFKASVATMESASTRYSERIQASVESLNEQLESIQKLGAEIDKVLRTTQSVETTLRSVGSSDEFRQTLANLRTHLQASDELLKQMAKPRRVVFQEQRAEE